MSSVQKLVTPVGLVDLLKNHEPLPFTLLPPEPEPAHLEEPEIHHLTSKEETIDLVGAFIIAECELRAAQAAKFFFGG